LSDKRNSILLLLFNISLECVFNKVQASAEDVNFLGQTDFPLRKTEGLLASSKKVGLAVMLRKLCLCFMNRTQDKITI
jgi:hypothetical protein